MSKESARWVESIGWCGSVACGLRNCPRRKCHKKNIRAAYVRLKDKNGCVFNHCSCPENYVGDRAVLCVMQPVHRQSVAATER